MHAEARQPVLLVVDDDRELLASIEQLMPREPWIVAAAGSADEASKLLGEIHPDLLLLGLPGAEASLLIERLAARRHSVPFVIAVSRTEEHLAVEMMKRGALDYVVKDDEFLDLLPEVVRRALERIDREGRLQRAEKHLEASEARLRSTLDNMLEGCQIVSRSWRYVYVNAAAARHGRRTRDEMIGRTLMELYPGIESAEVFPFLRKCMDERTPSRIENEFVFVDGSSSVFDLNILPFENGILILSNDITERKHLEKQVLEISEREQSRIGRDLHDGLCQHLAGIEFRLLHLKQSFAGQSKAAADEITELTRLVRDAIEQTRTLARGLSPVMLEPGGLMTALEDLARNIHDNFNVPCGWHCPEPVPIHNNAVATHLYRIAQEALHNSVRHGRAKSIAITLVRRNDRIILGVRDDGIGIGANPSNPGRGMGLRVMQYRAGMVGGTLVVQHEAGGGTSVVCSLRAETARLS